MDVCTMPWYNEQEEELTTIRNRKLGENILITKF